MERARQPEESFILSYSALGAVALMGAVGVGMMYDSIEEPPRKLMVCSEVKGPERAKPSVDSAKKVALTRDEIVEKVRKATVVIEFTADARHVALCTGYIASRHSFVTAKHCVLDVEKPGHLERPLKKIYRFPYDQKSIKRFDSGGRVKYLGFFQAGMDGISQDDANKLSGVVDIVEVELEEDVFPEKSALTRASVLSSSPTEKYFGLHFEERPGVLRKNSDLPVQSWKWELAEGRYAEDGLVGTDKYFVLGTAMKLKKTKFPLIPGNSGGAFVDENGEVVGVVSIISKTYSDVVAIAPATVGRE